MRWAIFPGFPSGQLHALRRPYNRDEARLSFVVTWLLHGFIAGLADRGVRILVEPLDSDPAEATRHADEFRRRGRMSRTVKSTYCSKRLGEISHDKFQAALSRVGLGQLIDVLPVTEGNFGQNTFLVTDRGEYVFRGCPHTPWQFAKERRFAKLLHEETDVPVPWPYLLDQDASLFGWPYVIMPRMQGERISDELCGDGVSKEDQIGISGAMGRALAGLQHLRNNFCGEYDAVKDEFRPFECNHAEYIRIRLLKGLETAGSTIYSEDRKWAEDQFRRAQPLLRDDFTPQFVMQDYKPGNVVVRKDADRWVVSGVFDFMEPFFADGEMDLCRTLCCCLEAGSYDAAVAFVSGYVSQTKLRPGYLERFPVYLMLDRLIIWNFAWRHGRPWWNKSLPFKEWLNLATLLPAFRQSAEATGSPQRRASVTNDR